MASDSKEINQANKATTAAHISPGPGKAPLTVNVAAKQPPEKSEEELISEIRSRYDLSTGDAIEKANKLLEMNEEIRRVTRPSRASRIEVLGKVDSWSGHKIALAENAEKISGKRPIFANARPEGRHRREAQGFKYVTDAKGNEVRVGDGVLMAMPMRQFVDEIDAPNAKKKVDRRSLVKSQFQNEASKVGVQAFGDITYDSRLTTEGDK